MTYHPPEFDCCECGRHIVAIGLELAPEPPLCSHCLFLPGWFTDASLRKVIDPGHDGREAVDLDSGSPPVV